MKKLFSVFIALVFSLLLNSNYVLANQIENETNSDKSSISNDNKTIRENNPNDSNSNYDDIFGDEQAFPFIAGLGKNAAH